MSETNNNEIKTMPVNEFIKTVIKKNNLSQIEVAERMKISKISLNITLNRKTKAGISVNNIIKMLDACGENLVVQTADGQKYRLTK